MAGNLLISCEECQTTLSREASDFLDIFKLAIEDLIRSALVTEQKFLIQEVSFQKSQSQLNFKNQLR